ncbi:hypothetical protein V6N13_036550 [Hibiscus sabdariffa]|uniref:O-methyltransferase dimerisation domain-containing protein n=1 Tax=Hibiscus sabdariffa TaxID=183260 RepID=A0ABR2S692_9ROSI
MGSAISHIPYLSFLQSSLSYVSGFTPDNTMDSIGGTQMTPTQVSDEEANLFAMQLASASVLPMVLKSAIELGLLEIMAKAGPGVSLSPKEVASKLPTTNLDAPIMLDRILRLLASYSILTCSLRSLPDDQVVRLYGLGPVGQKRVNFEIK